LFVKSLSKTPDPNNFFDLVMRNELGIIDSDNNEFFASHLCCLPILRLLSMLKLKNVGNFGNFESEYRSCKVKFKLLTLKLTFEAESVYPNSSLVKFSDMLFISL
jgi:hypothetical protein